MTGDFKPHPHMNPLSMPPQDRALTRDEVAAALRDLSIEAMEYGRATVLCGTLYSRALIDAEAMLKGDSHEKR